MASHRTIHRSIDVIGACSAGVLARSRLNQLRGARTNPFWTNVYAIGIHARDGGWRRPKVHYAKAAWTS